MGQQPKEAIFSTFTINVTQKRECSATPSLTIRLLSTTELAPEIPLSSNTIRHIFNSQGSSVIPTGLSTNAVSGTESAWQRDVTASWRVRLVWARPIATLTSIVMFSSPRLANMLSNQENFATLQTCATWEADANSTPVRQLAENAWSTSLFLQLLVSHRNLFIECSYLCQHSNGSTYVLGWLRSSG